MNIKDQVIVYAGGIVHCSVCAPVGMQRKVIETRVNDQNPTGIGSRWQISKDAQFRGGEPNPCACDKEPNRRHYLMVC